MHNRIAVIITSINKLNRNIQNLSSNSKKKNWSFIVIGDKKSPKNFSLKYGKYYNIRDQKKTKINFAKICPLNSYARKNVGYLLAIKKISSMSQGCPAKWTGIIAFVLLVINFSI